MAQLALFGGPPVVTIPEPKVPPIREAEAHAVGEILEQARNGDWSTLSALSGYGPIKTFEQQFAQWLGARFAIALSSGTMALEVALRASGIGVGDEVILSPYDWGAAAGAVLRLGAIPVFGDIDPQTYTLNPGSVEAHLTTCTKAIVLTHLFGHPADLDPILTIARRDGLVVIEDCAQALGARYRGRFVGTFGTFGCFSVGRGKLVSGGEGGVLVTSDERLYEMALFLSQHPLRQLAEVGRIGPLGDLAPNGRIHPLAAVIASVQLHSAERRIRTWQANCERLSKGLAGILGIRPVFVAQGCEPTYQRYSPTFVPEELEGLSREMYVAALAAEGVPIHLGFIRRPLHLHPIFRQRSYGKWGWPWRFVGSSRKYRHGDCPQAEARCARFELGLDVLWSGDDTRWLTQLQDAFAKVAEHREELKNLAASLNDAAPLVSPKTARPRVRRPVSVFEGV